LEVRGRTLGGLIFGESRFRMRQRPWLDLWLAECGTG